MDKILPAVKFLVSFIFVFGAVVFFHELGHFITAKLFGVRVEEFALGMGPRIWGFTKGETEYKLCLFPIGGYVKMSGEEPEEAKGKTLSEHDYYGQPPYKRFLITFSGPLMNFVLAFVIFIVVYMLGLYDYQPVVGPVEAGSPAEQAGIKSGDVIVSASGKKIHAFSEVFKAIDKAKESLTLKVKRDGAIKTFDVSVSTKKEENIFGEIVDMNFIGIDADIEPVVSDIAESSPASFFGLRPGDKIKKINDTDIVFWQDIYQTLNENNESVFSSEFHGWEKTWNALMQKKDVPALVKIVWLTVERGEKIIRKPIVIPARKKISPLPIEDEKDDEYIWLIGIEPDMPLFSYSFPAAIGKSAERIQDTTAFIFKVFEMLFRGKLGKKALGGPIMIGKMIKKTTEHGLVPVLIFTAVLSLHLGIINYFPFPALDGGHMVFSIIEIIRRKPLSLKVMEYIQKTGFAILIALIIYVSYYDILRLAGE